MPSKPMSLMYVTFDSEADALRVARAVIQARLAACANLRAAGLSLYEWEGEIQESREWVLLLKTVSSRVDALQAAVLDLHPYTTPCVIHWQMDGGHPDFVDWVRMMSTPEEDSATTV